MKKTYSLCLIALFTALVFVATAIQIPIPLGYANLGDSVIMFVTVTCGPLAGALAGAIGASLTDVATGYPIWAPFTFVIKAVIALLVAWIAGKSARKNKVRMFAGTVVSMIFMAAAYTVSGIILYDVAGGLASAPGLIAEGIVNIVVFYVLYYTLEKAGLSRRIMEIFNGAQ